MANTEASETESPRPGWPRRFLRKRFAIGCLVTAMLAFCIAGTLFFYGYQSLGRMLRQLGSPFAGLVKTDINDEFHTFLEKTVRVNKLVLLERRSTELVTRRIDQTYALPGLERFSVSDQATINIRCHVAMTYYVDLREKWQLKLQDSCLRVVAPPIRIAPPAIDPGRIEREINGGWLVFGEAAMLKQLEKELQTQLRAAAMQPVNLERHREECRKSLEDFIRTWLLNSHHKILRLNITFSGAPKTAREQQ